MAMWNSQSCAKEHTTIIQTTSRCHQHNHPEITFEVDCRVVSAYDVCWLIKTLERAVAKGACYEEGQTIQLGWLLASFSAGYDGTLKITEPDMNGLPINFVDGVTNTLRDLREQKDVLASLAEPRRPVFCDLRKPMVVSKSFKDSEDFVMLREPETPFFSGWYFCDNRSRAESEDDFDLLSIYEIGCQRPDLVKFLTLPVRYAVEGKEDAYGILYDADPVSIREGSYLAAVNEYRSSAKYKYN
jgi:hypothetical protein